MISSVGVMLFLVVTIVLISLSIATKELLFPKKSNYSCNSKEWDIGRRIKY